MLLYLYTAFSTNLTSVSADEYAVYSVVVEDYFEAAGEWEGTLPIATEVGGATPLRVWLPLQIMSPSGSRRLDVAQPSTVRSTRARSLVYHSMEERLSLPGRYRFVEEAERELPYVRLSRAGFSLDGNQALVYFQYLYGLRGGGEVYLLEKQDGDGAVVQTATTWAS